MLNYPEREPELIVFFFFFFSLYLSGIGNIIEVCYNYLST